jgi:anti-anti-sigma factor
LQLLSRKESTVIPLRRAYGTIPRRHASSDSSEMTHDPVHRAVRESSSDMRLGLSGEFDIYNKRQLAATLASCVAYRTITIDLAQTRFIDAGTIGVFARFADLRRELGAVQLRIVNVNRFMSRLFSICGLDTLFSIEEQRLAER